MNSLEDDLEASEVQQLLRGHDLNSHRFDGPRNEVKFVKIKDWCRLGEILEVDYKIRPDQLTADDYQEVSFNYRGWNFKSGTFTR